MRCYNCGAELSRHSYCTNCRVDVSVYKRIMHISNRYYNDGLEKANVRDLSGAVISLRQSLKFNKENIEARNLLGLVYYEMGEVVAALSEWVISKNLRPRKNLADDYIEAIQSNPTRLDTINQTVKKFNLALHYCYQDSKDLAIIQLKKVLSLNPRLVQGHQLLALLYIDQENWERARRELIKCCKVDANNTTTLSYLKLVNEMLKENEEASGSNAKKTSRVETRDAVTYQSGNETIIQPLNVKEPKGTSSILNILIGLLIGLAVSYFLILPARIQIARNSMKEELKVVSENLDAKSARVSELEQAIENMKQENASLESSLSEYTGSDGETNKVDSLMQAAIDYLSSPEDYKNIADMLYTVDSDYLENSASEAYKQLYNKLVFAVGANVAGKLYESGTNLVNQSDYSSAIDTLNEAWFFSKNLETPNAEILYELAHAYSLSGEDDKAQSMYSKILSEFPDSEAASKTKDKFDGDVSSLPKTNNSSSQSNTGNSEGNGEAQNTENNEGGGEAQNNTTEETTDNLPANAADPEETVIHE